MSDTTEAVDETQAAEEDLGDLGDYDWLLDELDEVVEDSDTEPAAPEGEEQAEGDEPPEDLHTLKVRGADKQVSYEELVQLAQMGEDYTQKTQELAAQREALQPLIELVEALDANPDATLRWLAEQYGVDFEVDLETEDPRDAQIRRLNADVQRVQKQAAIEQAKREIHADLNALQQRYGEFDRDELVEFAATNRLPDLNQAYFAWVGQKSLTQRQQEAKDEAAAKKRKSAAVVETEPSRRSAVPSSKGKVSVAQAFGAAARQLGIEPRHR